jgi:hypothetical protein
MKTKLSRGLKVKLSLILLSVVLGIWLVFRLLAWGQCSWYGYQTDRVVRYAAFMGCMVQVKQHWVPRNELRTEQ